MSEPYWEVYINISHSEDVLAVYLTLLDVIEQNCVTLEDHPLPIQTVTANQLRARSMGGKWDWAIRVGGDLQIMLLDMKINATVASVRKNP